MPAPSRPLLELVRIYLAPTAAADSVAGFFLASALEGRSPSPPHLVLAVVTSLSLYAYGMALNDLFDEARDRVRAPARPLPSGRISRRAASAATVVLAALAILSGSLGGALLPALAVLASATAYDAGAKRLGLAGDLALGVCRGGNLLIGASSAAGTAALGRPVIVVACLLPALWALTVTAVSRLEDSPPRPSAVRRRGLVALVVPLVLASAAAPALSSTPAWLNAAALAGLILLIGRRVGAPPAGVHPASVAVRSALGGIFLVDAGLLWTFGPAGTTTATGATALYGLAVLGWWWKRRWVQSGRSET